MEEVEIPLKMGLLGPTLSGYLELEIPAVVVT